MPELPADDVPAHCAARLQRRQRILGLLPLPGGARARARSDAWPPSSDSVAHVPVAEAGRRRSHVLPHYYRVIADPRQHVGVLLFLVDHERPRLGIVHQRGIPRAACIGLLAAVAVLDGARP